MVGVLEQLELSLQVFEAYLPLFFHNATALYRLKGDVPKYVYQRSQSNSTLMVNSNPQSKVVQAKTRSHLMTSPVFQLDYEFYHFIKQRLFKQAKFLGLA